MKGRLVADLQRCDRSTVYYIVRMYIYIHICIYSIQMNSSDKLGCKCGTAAAAAVPSIQMNKSMHITSY